MRHYFLLQVNVQAVTVQVVNDERLADNDRFPLALEEDNSYHAVPGSNCQCAVQHGGQTPRIRATPWESTSTGRAPTVCSQRHQTPSHVTIGTANCPGYTPSKRYIVSVLPWHTSAAEPHQRPDPLYHKRRTWLSIVKRQVVDSQLPGTHRPDHLPGLRGQSANQRRL